MVSIKSVLFSSAALLAAYMNVEAAVAPTYPSPGAIEKAGEPIVITWTFDGKDPDATYKIDFMTGSNIQQKKLATVATGVKADALKYTWTAPEVNPNSAIYFFMFTGSNGDMQWTTRFGISGADGKLVAESETKQPDGQAIPWGNGALASGAAAGSNSASGAADTAASTPVPTAVSSDSEAAVPAATPVPSSVDAVSTSAPAVHTAYITSTVTKHAAAPTDAVETAAQVAPATNAGSSLKPAVFSTLAIAAVAAYFA